MPKTKPTLNQADIDLLKQSFATKDDLNGFVTKEDLNKQLKPLKKDFKQIKNDLNMVIGSFDRELVYQSKRVDRLDNHLGLAKLPKTA